MSVVTRIAGKTSSGDGVMPTLRLAALGAASGLRSGATPLAVSRILVHARRPRVRGRAATLLSRPLTLRLLGLFSVSELIMDKLPQAPDRTQLWSLAFRALNGAIPAAVFAQKLKRSWALGATIGGGAAVLAAYAGFNARRFLTERAHLPKGPVAAGEDALAFAIARNALA